MSPRSRRYSCATTALRVNLDNRPRTVVAAARRSPRPGAAYARRIFGDARVRTIGFAYAFAIYAFIQPYGYRVAYPTVRDRLTFATSFGANRGLRIFYGEPFNLVTVGGYSAWRVGGTLAIAAAVFGLLAGVRALRAEEEDGRLELVLAGQLTRTAAYVAALVGIAAQASVLFAAEFAGFLVGRLPTLDAAYLSLATVSVIPVCAAVGALVSEIAPTRRTALEYGGIVVAAFVLARAVADTTSGAAWLRWVTPLGWAESARPFAHADAIVLAIPVIVTVVLVVVSRRLGRDRDVGSGLVSARDTRTAHLQLLSSPIAQAIRSARGSVLAWVSAVAVCGFVLGVVSQSVSSSGIPASVQRKLEKLGYGSIITPAGYLSFLFFFFILVTSVFGCTQVVSARREEAEGQLESVLASPVGRTRWLGGRALVALSGVTLVALGAGASAWCGAALVGVRVSFGSLLAAGANGVPTAALYLGVAVLAYGAVPRASSAVTFGIVVTTYLWDAVAALVHAPSWAADLTPFAWVGYIPSHPFRLTPALGMIAIAVVAAALGIAAFRRRDLMGA